MNERVKKIAEQVGGFVSLSHEHENKLILSGEDTIEKFAELIVKKFDDILILEQLDCIGNKDKKAAALIEKIRNNTKTYFGVEE